MGIISSTLTLKFSGEAAKPVDILEIRRVKNKIIFSVPGIQSPANVKFVYFSTDSEYYEEN
ncbi:hypothetical protein [Methanosarcina acetivorans]|uniref:hypothetical protein n=1 Tax=Methanosarcina acetivorans TaxID=2214 RepID=UPI00064F8465|nr:hypothetical protein [Methanosarcina acetivorans]